MRQKPVPEGPGPRDRGAELAGTSTRSPRGQHDSEASAIEAWRAQGFTASFVAKSGALRLLGGTRDFRPDQLTIRGYQRFEGVSDPDDMSIVYAIETADGIKGTLVDAFGVYANPAVSAVMDRVTARGRVR